MKKPTNRLAPVHPGDVLREDFMKPLGLSAYAVAKALGATPIAISQIIRHQRGVSAEMAIKLGRHFNVSPELWMGIQADMTSKWPVTAAKRLRKYLARFASIGRPSPSPARS